MSSTQNKARQLRATGALLIAFAATCSVANAEQFFPNFENQGKNIPGYPEPNRRMVVLPTGVADITAQRFKLPKDTYTYNIAGMTMFPYYQASPELKEFLNNARVGGVPITNLPTTQNIPQTLLPPTDTIRINIPIPTRRPDKKQFEQLALHKQSPDEIPWMVGHKTGQSFVVPGDPSGLLMVSSGTMFNACAPSTMVLRCGTMWVVSGVKPVKVLTKYGAVEVKPNSIAAVEQTWFNRVRISSLYGTASEVQFAYKGNNTKQEVALGKEIKVNESTVASSGASDYVNNNGSKELLASKPLQAPAVELNIATRNLDSDASNFITELKAIDPPIANAKMATAYKSMFSQFGITPEMRRDEIRRQILQRDTIANQKTPSYKESLDSRYFVPAARTVHERGPIPFPRVADALKTTWLQNGAAKYLESAKLEIDQYGRVDLSSGEAILVAKDPLSVKINECFVNIDDGAIVQVIARKNATVIRNLREIGSKSVTAKIKSRSIDCSAGEELVIANSVPAAFSEMKNDGVSRRNVRSIETAQGSVIVNKSEFELTSLLQYSPIMRQIYESKNDYDQKIVNQIVKMDAVLTLTGGKRGAYQKMAELPSSH